MASELDEFRNLNKIAPLSMIEAEKLCSSLENFIRNHPELRGEIKRFQSFLVWTRGEDTRRREVIA